MPRSSAILILLAVGSMALPTPAAGAQVGDDGAPPTLDRPRVEVPRVAEAPPLDPALDDPIWEQAARLEDWVQTSPGDNVPPMGRTVARLSR